MDLLTPAFGVIFWQAVTLFVVLMVLRKFAWRPVLGAVQQREQGIAEALRAAELAKEMAKEVEAERERFLKTADQERDKIVVAAMATRDKLIDVAKEEAETVRQQMIEQAQAAIAKEHEKASEALKAQVAVLAITVAEKLLKKEFSDRQVQETFVTDLVKEMEV